MSVIRRAIKYRLYPTTEQADFFIKTFGCCRKVYNLMLADKIQNYKETGSFGTFTPAMYKKDYPYLKEVDSLALANKQQDLQNAFENHFSKKRKKKNGFPKFKSAKHSRRSYTTNNQNGTVRLTDNSIRLPKVGFVKTVIHRKPEKDWILKSATVSQEPDGTFYVSVLFEYEKPVNNYTADLENAIGLDYASDGLYVDSYGNKGSGHKFFRESQKKLAKEQRKLAKKVGNKKGSVKSNNYMKQLHKVNKIHRHVANQRLDYLQKKSTEIANQYDAVCVETLDMKAMSNKDFGNGKATMDNGYGILLRMLEYKLAERNKYFIKVDKWYPSSQKCHSCGMIHPEMKDLRERTMRCSCGNVISRDVNAALNIRDEGLRILHKTLTPAA